jgi:hypothetical protein
MQEQCLLSVEENEKLNYLNKLSSMEDNKIRRVPPQTVPLVYNRSQHHQDLV